MLLFGCAPLDDKPDFPPCEIHALSVDLINDWRFRLDPTDVGRDENWQVATYDDSHWREGVIPGQPWEAYGIIEDGVGWYRLTLTLPAWENIFLGITGVDDAGALWLNGELVAEWEQVTGQVVFLDLGGYAGDTVTLAFRIEDFGGFGGLKDTLKIATDPALATTADYYLRWLAQQYPQWPLPLWTRNQPLAWTMTGGLAQSNEALVSNDGAVAPWARAPIVEAWLYNRQSGQLFASGDFRPQFSLRQAHLPLPQWRWSAGPVHMDNQLFYDETDASIRWLLDARNDSDIPHQVFIAVRPFAVNRSANPIASLSLLNTERLWVNGAPFMSISPSPAKAAVGHLAEMMEAALSGQIPPSLQLPCAPLGDGAAILAYDLPPKTQLAVHLAFPSGPMTDSFPAMRIDVNQHLDQMVARWSDALGRITLRLPDDRIQSAALASIAYLLLADDPNGPHPGPLAHNALWVRDAAYIGLALLQAGHTDIVPRYVEAVFAAQEPNGKIPPIQGEDAPWDDDEWDSQGQAIFLASAYARYSGDFAYLERFYPQIRLSAEFIRSLRSVNQEKQDATRGLLPPSLSAEDLGPPDQHYYWDNFWAIIGLEEAASIARRLGHETDAQWMEAEAQALRRSVLSSIQLVMGEAPPYIPVSVEEQGTPAMARGSVTALWPVELFPDETALLARAFDYYHQQWINPYNGGFIHREAQFWPYAGSELAHAYLRLGRGDVLHQILGWNLAHQTLDGTYAWAEQVSPTDYGFTGGDMPHAWAAASFYTLTREMLVRERDDALILFSSAPSWWFEAGREIVFLGAPTYYGQLDLRTDSAISAVDERWQGRLQLDIGGASPPKGFRWQLSQMPDEFVGPAGTDIQDGWLIIPTAGQVTLIFGAN